MGFIILSIVLFILCLFLIIINIYYIVSIKGINERYETIKNQETNVLLDCPSDEKNLVCLVKNINHEIERSRKTRIELDEKEREIKSTITNISHDLRTPITSLLGYTTLLKKNNLSDEEKEYVNIIDNRLNVMKQLIEDLFSYTLAYENDLDINKENINVILEDSLALYYNDLINKGINVNVNIISDEIYYDVDKLALKRVFSNILSNVVKYGINSLDVKLESDKVIFRNETNNIDTIDVGKLFDRFFTLAKARNNSTGIGLTIAKILITKMNYHIQAYKEDDKLVIEILFIKTV